MVVCVCVGGGIADCRMLEIPVVDMGARALGLRGDGGVQVWLRAQGLGLCAR